MVNPIIQPNALHVRCDQIPEKYAYPATAVAHAEGIIRVFTFGGMSKLELVTAHIAARMNGGATPDQIVSRAAAILEACEKYQKAQQEKIAEAAAAEKAKQEAGSIINA